jgi:hypothetical protein
MFFSSVAWNDFSALLWHQWFFGQTGKESIFVGGNILGWLTFHKGLLQYEALKVWLRPGLSMGRAARSPDTPDRPLHPPDKGQTGIDWPPMVNLKSQTGAGALPWTATSTAILHVTTSAGNSKKSYCSKVNLEQ